MNSLIQRLMRPDAYDHPITRFELLETHISWVILTGPFAYKLKKPVNLGFVDFTTLDRRFHFCQEEIRLNRRLAPDMYLAVKPIHGPVETPSFSGTGEPIEYAVQMRQFDQTALLPAVLKRGELQRAHMDVLARTIARFHSQATVADDKGDFGTPEQICRFALDNFESLEATGVAKSQVAALRDWTEAEFSRRNDWFQSRLQNGQIRECHGDMHLGNMVLQNNIVEIFDCLEFNPELRWIDIISEVAFLAMDLQDRGRPDFALHVTNRWLEQTGDFDGLMGWRWYMTYRAAVRAKVAGLRLRQEDLTDDERTQKRAEVQDYLTLAHSYTRDRSPVVVIMQGLSGSGKSAIAEWICENHSSILTRSDIERKRLFGLWGAASHVRRQGNLYATEVTETLYRQTLADIVRSSLAAGLSIVVDATFLKRWQRDFYRQLSESAGADFVIVQTQASQQTLRNRITLRQQASSDPSDATIEVMQRQAEVQEALAEDELSSTVVIDTEKSNYLADLKIALQRWFP